MKYLGTKFEIKAEKHTQWYSNPVVTCNIYVCNESLPSTPNSDPFKLISWTITLDHS